MCRDILTVVVGSRLHGLARDGSDTDLRGVFVNDVRDMVNPFEKPPEKRWVEGAGKDDTASELRKFINEVVSGGPNAIEVLFSNQVKDSTVSGVTLRAERQRFLNTEKIFTAYRKYSENQVGKMNLFVPDYRTPKFAVAYIRTLLNGIELLRDGTITNPVPEGFGLSDGSVVWARDVLMEIKFTPWEEFDKVRQLATDMFARLQVELSQVFYSQEPQVEDREWIIDFVRRVYNVA